MWKPQRTFNNLEKKNIGAKTTTSQTATTTTTTTAAAQSNRVIAESIDWNEGLCDWPTSHGYPSFKTYLSGLNKRRANRGLGEFDESAGMFLPPQPFANKSIAAVAQKENLTGANNYSNAQVNSNNSKAFQQQQQQQQK